jgi:hypothetical protein
MASTAAILLAHVRALAAARAAVAVAAAAVT